MFYSTMIWIFVSFIQIMQLACIEECLSGHGYISEVVKLVSLAIHTDLFP